MLLDTVYVFSKELKLSLKIFSTTPANGHPNHHVIYPPPSVPPPPPSSTIITPTKGGKKSSPQFRWRRRKRRSKAQYPEMSRYLLPIDDGEEVQHLGKDVTSISNARN